MCFSALVGRGDFFVGIRIKFPNSATYQIHIFHLFYFMVAVINAVLRVVFAAAKGFFRRHSLVQTLLELFQYHLFNRIGK